jgi:hypothetical protein
MDEVKKVSRKEEEGYAEERYVVINRTIMIGWIE